MRKTLLLFATALAMMASMTSSSCNNDDDDTKKPETPTTPDKPDTPDKPGTETDAAVKEGYCPDAKHPHLIDLGEGMQWACCNVGASNPSEYGGYYAWGETEEKKVYDITTYAYSDKKDENSCWELKKMFDVLLHKPVFSYSISLTDYDVAYVKWGDNWMMPNDPDIEKLIEKCNYDIKKLNGVEGCRLTGPSGKYIFLPGGGRKDKDKWSNNWAEHPVGFYWGATRDMTVAAWDAYGFTFDNTEIETVAQRRMLGFMVRAIKNSTK